MQICTEFPTKLNSSLASKEKNKTKNLTLSDYKIVFQLVVVSHTREVGRSPWVYPGPKNSMTAKNYTVKTSPKTKPKQKGHHKAKKPKACSCIDGTAWLHFKIRSHLLQSQNKFIPIICKTWIWSCLNQVFSGIWHVSRPIRCSAKIFSNVQQSSYEIKKPLEISKHLKTLTPAVFFELYKPHCLLSSKLFPQILL